MSPDFDVVALPPCDPPAVGERAPDFERPLVTTDGWRDASLASQTEDGPVLLAFHPMLGSFPATYFWQEVTARSWADRFGVRLIGVVISTPYDARGFLLDRRVDGAFFSDPANGVAAEYDLVHDLDGMAGIAEPRPAVFLLDTDRTVTYAWVASRWPDFPDYEAVEEAIAAESSG